MQDRHIEAALGGNGEASAASVQPAAALNVTVGAVPWPWEGPANKCFCCSYIFVVNLLLSEASTFSNCSPSAEGHIRYFLGSDSDCSSVRNNLWFQCSGLELANYFENGLGSWRKKRKANIGEETRFCRGKIVFKLHFQKFAKLLSDVSSEVQIRDLKNVKEKEQCCNSGEYRVTREESWANTV